MAKKKRLVLQHLEDISWRVLEEYPNVVQQMIRRKSGVYALYRKQSLYYVGLASNLMGRLKTHLKDRHHGSWDRFSVYLTIHDDHMKELESLLLRIVNPSGNKVIGKFTDSDNLSLPLNQHMKDADADRRALMIGGQVARRRCRTKTKQGKGTKNLSGIFDRRIALKASHLGREFRASLRKDGSIGFNNKVYDSPTGAAKEAIGRTRNGWSFWRYRNTKGKWVKLRELRK
ncbi:MAG: GIY-YIG nuclease family protein [Planctomycetota bacterium]